MSNNDTNIKKIDGRDWTIVRNKWLSHIPTISTPGDAPAIEVKDFPDLSNINAATIAVKGAAKLQEVAGLRNLILHEGIYLLHKAIHVSGSAIFHLENGMKSWSLSSAYHSSFYAVKGILSCLGLSFPKLSKYLMIDCFPKDERSKTQIRNNPDGNQALKFITFNDIGHVEHFEILQRVLKMSEIACWENDWVEYLTSLNSDEFAKERNNLHYINNYWPFPPDLHSPVIDKSFAIDQQFTTDFIAFLTSCGKQHPFFMNYVLLRMGMTLLKDLGTSATIINDEYQLMLTTLNAGNHTRFLNSIDVTVL